MENSADGKTVQAAKEEICNTAINLIWQCQNSNLQDKDALKKIAEICERLFKGLFKK